MFWSWKRGLFATVNHSDIRGLLTATVSRARMIVIRRELPRSRDVGQPRLAPARHIGVSRVLRTAASPPGPGHCLQDPFLPVSTEFRSFTRGRAADVNRRYCAGDDGGQGARSAPPGLALDDRRNGRYCFASVGRRARSSIQPLSSLCRFLCRTVLGDRPDESRQLPRHGHRGDLG